MEKKFLPSFDPRLHEVVQAYGFVPGDVVTIKITARSLGTVFICKAVSEDPEVSFSRESQLDD